jgi:hypothetical protein
MDAVGALTSAFCLMLLYRVPAGLPAHLMAGLVTTAAALSVYSFACHCAKPKSWPQLLRGAAIANLAYAITTVFLCFRFFDQLILLARVYFMAECCVLVVLAGVELQVARNHSPNQ